MLNVYYALTGSQIIDKARFSKTFRTNHQKSNADKHTINSLDICDTWMESLEFAVARDSQLALYRVIRLTKLQLVLQILGIPDIVPCVVNTLAWVVSFFSSPFRPSNIRRFRWSIIEWKITAPDLSS